MSYESRIVDLHGSEVAAAKRMHGLLMCDDHFAHAGRSAVVHKGARQLDRSARGPRCI